MVCLLICFAHTNREGELYDGTRLISGLSPNDDGTVKDFVTVHPSFRIIALAQVSTKNAERSMALPAFLQHHQDLIGLFSWLHLKPLTSAEHRQVLSHTFPTLSVALVHKLMMIEEGLGSKEEGEDLTLSTRQLMRLARRLSSLPPQVSKMRTTASVQGSYVLTLDRTCMYM